MQHRIDDEGSTHIPRRDVLRHGASAALLVWVAPTIVTWSPSPAHAGTPPPHAEEEHPRREAREAAAVGEREPAQPADAPEGRLAVTGSGVLPLAVAGAAAAAAGTAAVRRARSAQQANGAVQGDATTEGEEPTPPRLPEAPRRP